MIIKINLKITAIYDDHENISILIEFVIIVIGNLIFNFILFK